MKALFASKSPTPNKAKPPRVPKENMDPNLLPADSSPYRSPGITKIFSAKIRSPLPPRPPLKRKLSSDLDSASPSCTASDSGVQVIVRIRPPIKEEEEEESVVRKLSSDSVSISEHNFTFDSVADTGSTQDDVFRLVGLPLVENCLAGFNSSIFAYGQTGSGKTYTMWGPSSALLEDNSLNSERGLTPRVFERLFARINEEKTKHAKKELTYHSTCSFLEIYKEQITDLLDPTQRNLQIREDVGTGVYVESLTVEYVESLKDVTQLLIKGLANRRTGATSVNAESSRSHCVFTCVIRSQFKNADDGQNAARISRINLVDLAGSERQKLTKAAGDRLKEAGNINKSLSQLGNLINILGEISQSGKQRHIPYRDSKLTFLLQESLGGNAKLAMICGVSPSLRCKSESLSTLRFAQRAKAIKNKAVINETTQDDVKMLREQVRLLRDELVRMKSNNKTQTGDGYSTVEDARRTVNLLRMSLTCTSVMPAVTEDSDEEMEIVENNEVRNPPLNTTQTGPVQLIVSLERKIGSPKSLSILPVERKSLSPLSESQSRKSPKTSSSLSPSQKAVQEESGASTDTDTSTDTGTSTGTDAQNEKADTIAASINKGLDIFETGMRKKRQSARRASFSFFNRDISPVKEVLVPLSIGPVNIFKVDACTQTVPEELEEVMKEDSSVSNSADVIVEGNNNYTGMELVPVDVPVQVEKPKRQKFPKAVKKLLAGSIRREMELESLCARQSAEIQQLNRLVQQYKHERECNAIIAQTREDKISRLETLMDGVLPTEEFIEEEFLALQKEHKHLKNMYENHPDLLYINIELKRAKEELEKYKTFCDLGEREVLLEEIQDLKAQLNHYLSSPASSLNRIILSSSNPTGHLQFSSLHSIPEQIASWQETEAKWITLTQELERDLDSLKKQNSKLEIELEAEKRCSEELKEAVQMAVQGHARILDQYADLQEKHINLLAKNRRICEGIEDVKKAASKAGVARTELKFINSVAQEISVLRLEREKERKYWRDENKGLQGQLREMAEAVQAAGELVVRLKEAEETSKKAQKRARVAEQETEKAYQEIESLKKNYDDQILLLKEAALSVPQNAPRISSVDLAASIHSTDISQNAPELSPADVTRRHRTNFSENEHVVSPADVASRYVTSDSHNTPEMSPADVAAPRYDTGESKSEEKWREEFEPFGINGSGEVLKETDPSLWFFGYDKCNI